jgi:hypothetical protein
MKPQAGPWPGKMTFYIDVDDLDQFGRKIRNAGGKIVVEKMEVPGVGWSTALGLAFAADTLSITLMELVDNAIMLLIPGAMDASVTSSLFWGSLILALVVTGVAAFP